MLSVIMGTATFKIEIEMLVCYRIMDFVLHKKKKKKKIIILMGHPTKLYKYFYMGVR